MPSFVTLTGKRATGKTTLVQAFRAQVQDTVLIRSTTTREPRDSDLDGEYRHVSRDEFADMKSKGAFLWDVDVGGNLYGTMRLHLDALRRKRTDTVGIMILAPDVLETFRDYLQEHWNRRVGADLWTPFLVSVPDELVLERSRSRGDDPKVVKARLAQERDWHHHPALHKTQFCHLINDGTIEHAIADMRFRTGL